MQGDEDLVRTGGENDFQYSARWRPCAVDRVLNVNPGYKLVNNAKYPRIADDFARTFRVLKALPCDVFLGAHGEYYGLQDKYQKLQQGGPNPFIDPTGYRNFVESKEQEYLRKLAAQR